MIQKTVEEIDKNDLLFLIENKVMEKKTLDYKEKFSGNSDADKKELLKDITSFANSSGGDIIYGVKEKEGIPIELVGIPNEEVDSKIRWVEDLVRQGIQPRIPDIKMQPIDIDDEKKALLIRIPKSWRSPHCVTLQNLSRFFARSSNGVYQLDIDELRSAFILSDTLKEKIQTFRIDRIANINANETELELYSKSNIILHIIPMVAFDIINKKIDIKQAFNNQKLSSIYYGAFRRRINFDGIVLYSEAIEAGKADSYIQLYKNGIIEAVESSMLSFGDYDGNKVIPHFRYEKALITSTKQYVEFLKEMDVEMPYYIFITLTGVKGHLIGDIGGILNNKNKIERDLLNPEPVMYEDDSIEIDVLLRPIFDSIWNASGYVQSVNYDERGRFNLNK